MPRYERSGGAQSDSDGDGGKDLIVVPEAWTEPRCHVCMSKYRKAIERMIALGTGHSEISRIFGGEIDRRSIANHAEKHLAYQESAIRQIIQREAHEQGENAELGISSEVKRRVYLETLLQKGMEQLVADRIMSEPETVLKVIDALNKMDRSTAGAQLEEIKIQFQAFLQAIREISAQRGDVTLGSDILIRARQIVGIQAPPPELGP